MPLSLATTRHSPQPLNGAAMEYIDVLWKHQVEHDPVRLLSELDASRIERRKLEFFKDGIVDAADGNVETERTRLSVEAVPSLGDINRDPQFEGSTITREAFEAQWLQHAADKQLLKAQSGQERTLVEHRTYIANRQRETWPFTFALRS